MNRGGRGRGERTFELLSSLSHACQGSGRQVTDRLLGPGNELLLDERETAALLDRPGGRFQGAGQQAEQRRLARSVLADDAEPVPRAHGETHAVEHRGRLGRRTGVGEGDVAGSEQSGHGPTLSRDRVWMRAGFGADAPLQARTRAISGASARNAWPRWLIRFFSSAVSSAHERVSPSGRRIGS